MAKMLLPSNNKIKVDGKSVYTLYLQLKNHFQGKRDVIKYDWKMKVTDSAYEKRKDKHFFERLSNKFSLKELCFIFIGNLLLNENIWVGEISDSDPMELYKVYLSKLKKVKPRFEDDIKSIYYVSKQLNIPMNEMFVYDSSRISYVFKLLQSNLITYESFIMLDSFMGIIDEYDKSDNLVWMKYSTRLTAYKKIFIVDSALKKSIYNDVVNNF